MSNLLFVKAFMPTLEIYPPAEARQNVNVADENALILDPHNRIAVLTPTHFLGSAAAVALIISGLCQLQQTFLRGPEMFDFNLGRSIASMALGLIEFAYNLLLPTLLARVWHTDPAKSNRASMALLNTSIVLVKLLGVAMVGLLQGIFTTIDLVKNNIPVNALNILIASAAFAATLGEVLSCFAAAFVGRRLQHQAEAVAGAPAPVPAVVPVAGPVGGGGSVPSTTVLYP